jgi:hypothetical protein
MWLLTRVADGMKRPDEILRNAHTYGRCLCLWKRWRNHLPRRIVVLDKIKERIKKERKKEKKKNGPQICQSCPVLNTDSLASREQLL